MNHRGRFTLFLKALLFLSAAGSGMAQTTDYTELSLEELTSVRIFTLGRKQATLSDTPNAASVVTAEDLHRSGALDLAEALRPVPGIQVARIDSFNYTINARGFNDPLSNKLLVLMDGRSLYSTTSTGTYWNYHELVLEDVDRIEVLRGPGASLWGANAMNGVINIVGKPAAATLGSLVSVARGNELDASVVVRQGFQLTTNSAARVYAKHQQLGAYGAVRDTGSGGWANQLLGTRFDWARPTGGGLTVIAELRDLRIWSETELPLLLPPFLAVHPETQRSRGGNVSAHWVQPMANESELSVLGTYERFDSTQLVSGEDRDTMALDAQLRLHPWRRQEVITGVTLRQDTDSLSQTDWTRFRHPEGRTWFNGAFIQDEVSVLPDRLLVTAGVKFERNSFSGWETQPSVRAILRSTKTNRTWIGLSRAARTPSRMERELESFAFAAPPSGPVPALALYALGSDTLGAEHVTALEAGHRFEPTPELSFDLSLYFNRYHDLRGLEVENRFVANGPVPRIDQLVTARNSLFGSTYGGEFVASWQAKPWCRLEGSVSAIRFDLTEYTPSQPPDQAMRALSGSTPREEWKLGVHLDPLPDWSVDASFHQVGALPEPRLPAYAGLDARIAWRPVAGWEIELIGRDLTDPMHGEASKSFIGAQVRETARSILLRATFRY